MKGKNMKKMILFIPLFVGSLYGMEDNNELTPILCFPDEEAIIYENKEDMEVLNQEEDEATENYQYDRPKNYGSFTVPLAEWCDPEAYQRRFIIPDLQSHFPIDDFSLYSIDEDHEETDGDQDLLMKPQENQKS